MSADFKIVIVEDHADTNLLLTNMLSRYFQVECASFRTAEDFTNWLSSHHKATRQRTIYLMDIILSENPTSKNGLDLAHEISESGLAKTAYIIIITGCPINETIRKRVESLKKLLWVSMFEKPVNPDKLLQEIESIVRMKDESDAGS